MVGETASPPWLETDWILGQFTRQRKRAIEKYINFVREGVGLPSIWSDLKNQVFLGSDRFINKHQKKINKKGSLDEVSRLQKRKAPRSLDYNDNRYKNQKQAILSAYLSGGYTLKKLGA